MRSTLTPWLKDRLQVASRGLDIPFPGDAPPDLLEKSRELETVTPNR